MIKSVDKAIADLAHRYGQPIAKFDIAGILVTSYCIRFIINVQWSTNDAHNLPSATEVMEFVNYERFMPKGYTAYLYSKHPYQLMDFARIDRHIGHVDQDTAICVSNCRTLKIKLWLCSY